MNGGVCSDYICFRTGTRADSFWTRSSSSSSSSSFIFHGVRPLLTRSGLTYPEVSSKVYHDSFCQMGSSISLPWINCLEAFHLHVLSSFSFFPIICPKFLLFLTPLQFVHLFCKLSKCILLFFSCNSIFFFMLNILWHFSFSLHFFVSEYFYITCMFRILLHQTGEASSTQIPSYSVVVPKSGLWVVLFHSPFLSVLVLPLL